MVELVRVFDGGAGEACAACGGHRRAASGEFVRCGDGCRGGEQQTDGTGRVLLVLAPKTRTGAMVPLEIVRSPRRHDFVMVSPWEGSARVPPFDNDAMNFVSVVVAERGDKALLENGKALAALTAKINQANAPKMAGSQAAEVSPKASLDAVSKQYGLAPEEVDRAIRAWGRRLRTLTMRAWRRCMRGIIRRLRSS